MTIEPSKIDVHEAMATVDAQEDLLNDSGETIDISVQINEPQILIGQGGQTLFEIQRLIRTVLNKKIESKVRINLDINDYKKQKIDYLKDIVKDIADQVAKSGQEKSLSPMSSYERMVVHAELAQRTDVLTESQGDGIDRHIVIRPK
jgi:spoIIIJ-associated protein